MVMPIQSIQMKKIYRIEKRKIVAVYHNYSFIYIYYIDARSRQFLIGAYQITINMICQVVGMDT